MMLFQNNERWFIASYSLAFVYLERIYSDSDKAKAIDLRKLDRLFEKLAAISQQLGQNLTCRDFTRRCQILQRDIEAVAKELEQRIHDPDTLWETLISALKTPFRL